MFKFLYMLCMLSDYKLKILKAQKNLEISTLTSGVFSFEIKTLKTNKN